MRLIDEAKVINEIERFKGYLDDDMIMRIKIAINRLPTIDAEPVKRGKWILTNKPNIYGGTTIKCSACGYEGVIAHIEDHHYCWVCGAKMDAEEVSDEADLSGND